MQPAPSIIALDAKALPRGGHAAHQKTGSCAWTPQLSRCFGQIMIPKPFPSGRQSHEVAKATVSRSTEDGSHQKRTRIERFQKGDAKLPMMSRQRRQYGQHRNRRRVLLLVCHRKSCSAAPLLMGKLRDCSCKTTMNSTCCKALTPSHSRRRGTRQCE